MTQERATIGRHCEPNTQPHTAVTVLLVSSQEEDHRQVNDMFASTRWILHGARDYLEADTVLRQRQISVVVTEAQLPGQKTWKDILGNSEMPGRPRVIVASGSDVNSLWAEVLNLGGYDFLMKPFDRTEVLRIVSLAWLNWRDEMQGHGLRARASV